jgi:predicted MPP superfamily phosphohydrolase
MSQVPVAHFGEPRARTSQRAWVLIALAGRVLAAFALIGLYAWKVEPNWIEVTRYTVPGPVAAPVRLVHLSDLHVTRFGFPERRVLELVEREKPDVIVVTGDVATPTGEPAEYRKILGRLHAPLGVWFVLGNWDHWRPIPHQERFFAACGVHLLVNESAELLPGVWLAGFDDPGSGACDVAATVATCCFVSGWYTHRASRLYGSRGIGTSILPFRFCCRPEIAVMTLEPSATQALR